MLGKKRNTVRITKKNLFIIWICDLYNLKNVKNTHGGILLWVKLQASVKLRKASQTQMMRRLYLVILTVLCIFT